MMISKLWSDITAAPHRVMFFAGAPQTIAAMVWLIEPATRYGVAGHPLGWSIAPGAAFEERAPFPAIESLLK